MKNKIVLSSIILLLAYFGFGQKRNQYRRSSNSQIDMGLYVGLGASIFTKRVGPFADGQSDEWNNGFSLRLNSGLFLKKELNNDLALHIELGYHQKGGGASMPNGELVVGQNGTMEEGADSKLYLFDYIELPVMIGIIKSSASYSNTNNYFNVGVSPSILVRQQYRDVDKPKEPIDLGRNFQVSLVADYQIIGNTKIPYFCVLRIYYTPTKVFKEDSINEFNYKTGVVAATFGLGLKF